RRVRIDILDEVDERIVHRQRLSSDDDRPFDSFGRDARVAVAELLVELSGRVVRDPVAEANPPPPALAGETLCAEREGGSDTAPALLREDVHVLHLGDTQLRVVPGDVRVPDRLVAVPRDEVGLRAFEAMER